MKPQFIVLEGIDGAGKSSHVDTIMQTVEALGGTTVKTREPGGTPLGEKLREISLHEQMTPLTETILMFAMRKENIANIIAPALDAGVNVVSDRFTDATYAYQGGGKGVSKDFIIAMENEIQQDLRPDLVLYFDVPVHVSKQRLDTHRETQDKFERESSEFFTNVRNAYLERAAANPDKFVIIDSTQPIEKVAADAVKAVANHFQNVAKATKTSGRKP